MGDLDFIIEIHHGGKFVDSGQRLEYLGGMVMEDLHFEVDEWSLQEIVSQLKQLGYKSFARVWYKEPGMDLKSGLRELKSDGDAMRMARESNGIEITSTDADYVPEEGEDSADDDGLLEVEVDAEIAAAGTAEGDEGLREGDEQVGGLSDGYETDDIDSYEGDSNDMIKKRRFPKYNEAEMNREYEFQVRCRVVCKGRKGKCKWVCFASKVGGSDCFRIKTLNGKHTCGRNYCVRLASSSWISKKIANNISSGEEMKLATVIQTIQDKYMANISVGKAYWARRKEKRPSLTHQPRFMRMYMCLDAVKKGFLAGCRPIIGVDGCHLKGDHGQQLLVAVGRDPNDNYFPIAVAAVEAETKDSCESKSAMFMMIYATGGFEHLPDYIVYTVFWTESIKQGLMQIFQEALPTLEHRLCLRHLYANCKKAYGGGAVLRDLILSIAKATYVEEWERRMNQLKELNRDCYEKLFALDPKLWTKSHFTFLAKSDMLMNNISEAFNGRILEARDKPILTMFEWIRCYLMTRFVEKKKKAERYEGTLLPKPKKRLDIIAVRAMEWQAKWAGDLKFEVHHKNRMIMERFVVDLMVGRCSCRFWGLYGMPCPHACCAIFEKGDNPEDYCSNYYNKAAYLATYG
ncbi:uncharacterized protein LOC107494166 [Arachis duranensis]|uniref:Uncharacterized protein LOC107494166 n=1 Tax=Arachis duranensis TaxID=130453 RepID=A0A6P4DQM3_ARADU|nr:uncharacterized protein LOC107494166 [Arachis duranensis]